MTFHLRTKDGELDVQNFAELQNLYRSGFIADEDEVRREGTDCWRKAGAMSELQSARPKPAWFKGNEFAWLAVIICVATLAFVAIAWLLG